MNRIPNIPQQAILGCVFQRFRFFPWNCRKRSTFTHSGVREWVAKDGLLETNISPFENGVLEDDPFLSLSGFRPLKSRVFTSESWREWLRESNRFNPKLAQSGIPSSFREGFIHDLLWLTVFFLWKKNPTNGKDPSLPRTFMIGSLSGSRVVGSWSRKKSIPPCISCNENQLTTHVWENPHRARDKLRGSGWQICQQKN